MINFRGSNLGLCPRKLAYEGGSFLNVTQVPTKQRLLDGWWHEVEVKGRLCDMDLHFESGLSSQANLVLNVNGVQILGHIDGIVCAFSPIDGIPLGRYILEVKSMGPGGWFNLKRNGLINSHRHHYDQLQGYLGGSLVSMSPITMEEFENELQRDVILGMLWALAAHYPEAPYDYLAGLPTKGLLVAKDKDSGELAYEVVERDPINLAVVKRRVINSIGADLRGELPSRLWDNPKNWECKNCPFRVQCWEGIVDEQPSRTLDDPDLLLFARMYAEGKAFEKRGEALMEDARPMLESVDGDYTLGPVKVSRRTQKAGKYEVTREEKEITTIRVVES